MSSPQEQLAAYRMERAREHRISKLPEKYAGLLVFNPRIRAFYRISRFFARLPRFSYCSVNGGEDIPGRFRYRVFKDSALYIYDLREIGPFSRKTLIYLMRSIQVLVERGIMIRLCVSGVR